MNFAILGCGGVGTKRAANLPDGCQLVACCDIQVERARALGPVEDIYKADAVIVATPHDRLFGNAARALQAGKHVLVEKPGSLSSHQLTALRGIASNNGLVLRVGYNHRFHRAIRQAREWLPIVGRLMFIRARYGHGGRPGYDKEWRMDPAQSGGGHLMDQGCHLIDLAQWFLGEFPHRQGWTTHSFWAGPAEDNAFLALRTEAQQVAWLHVSATEWKNLFSLELYGVAGKIVVEGLGGSYGVERATLYPMEILGQPPDAEIREFPQPDNSWKLELEAFVEDIRAGRDDTEGLQTAIRTLEIIEAIYRDNPHHQP